MAICMSEVYAIFLQNALRQANKLCALQKLWLFYYFIPCLSRNATPTMTLTMIMSNTLNSRNTQIQLNARFCNASLIGLVFLQKSYLNDMFKMYQEIYFSGVNCVHVSLLFKIWQHTQTYISFNNFIKDHKQEN